MPPAKLNVVSKAVADTQGNSGLSMLTNTKSTRKGQKRHHTEVSSDDEVDSSNGRAHHPAPANRPQTRPRKNGPQNSRRHRLDRGADRGTFWAGPLALTPARYFAGRDGTEVRPSFPVARSRASGYRDRSGSEGRLHLGDSPQAGRTSTGRLPGGGSALRLLP